MRTSVQAHCVPILIYIWRLLDEKTDVDSDVLLNLAQHGVSENLREKWYHSSNNSPATFKEETMCNMLQNTVPEVLQSIRTHIVAAASAEAV